MTLFPAVSLVLMLASGQTATPVPRDIPAPAVESARRERELRATITTGAATRETFVELSLLLIQQNRFDEAIEALRGAAAASGRFPETFDAALARLAPLRVGRDVATPTRLKDAKPVYPPIAQSARVQGVVLIEAILGEAGTVVNARVVRSIPLLDAAALDAVSRWQFVPTQVDGHPVAVLMILTVNFVLQ
jgi:TonB family protein